MINNPKKAAEKLNFDEDPEIEAQRLRIVLAQAGIRVAETLVASTQRMWLRDLNLVFCRNNPKERPLPGPCHVHPDDGAALEADMRNAWQSADGRFEMVFRVVDPPHGTHLVRSVGRLSREGEQERLVAALIAVADGQAKPSAAAAQQNQLVGARLRAARGLLNWSVRELAQAANVSQSTIRRMEDSRAADSVGPKTRHAVRQSLERAGLRFVAFGPRLALGSRTTPSA